MYQDIEKAYALAAKLGELLSGRNLTVTAAESCSAGGVAYAITAVPGSSAWFRAGFVTYSDDAKHRLLGVDQEVLDRDGAVSEAVVRQMARGAMRMAEADLAVAISGIAGPTGGSVAKPVGTVWFAWAERDEREHVERVLFAGDRPAVRSQSVIKALQGLIQLLESGSVADTCIKD